MSRRALVVVLLAVAAVVIAGAVLAWRVRLVRVLVAGLAIGVGLAFAG